MPSSWGRSLKILFLSTWFPSPPDNGSKIRVYHLLRALAKAHRVTLVSFSFGTADPEGAAALRQAGIEIQAVWKNPMERGRWLRALRFLSPVPIVTAPVAEMSRAVRQTLDGATFDVVIASTKATAIYAQRAPASMVRVIEEHNASSRQMYERYRAQDSAVGRLRCWASWQKARAYEARLFRSFDLCTMVSEEDAEATRRLFDSGRRVQVVPNGVDCQHNRAGMATTQPKSLVFNGALTFQANYDAMRFFLEQVYPQVRRQEADVSLTITGSTSGVDLAGLALGPGVRLSGYVDDVRPLVAEASVAIAPIRQGGGTRLKILEAMALGTPVVATTKAAEGLKVRHGHNILIADEAEDFAEQVVRLLREPALGRRLAAEARGIVEAEYDWRIIRQQFAGLVEEAVREGRGR